MQKIKWRLSADNDNAEEDKVMKCQRWSMDTHMYFIHIMNIILTMMLW